MNTFCPKKMPWSDGIKSMVAIELKTHKGVGGTLFRFPHQSQQTPPPVQLTSLGPHQARFFQWSELLGQTVLDGSLRLATTSADPPPFFPLSPGWTAGHSLLYFPGTLRYSSCPPHKGHLSQEAGEALGSFSFSSCVLGAVKTRSPLEA